VQAQGEIPGTKGVAHVPVPTDQRLPSPQSDKVAPLTGLNVNGVDHTPVIRQTNEPLFRNDSRDPSVIFQNGFQPKNTQSSPLHPFIDKNASSGFVSTTNQPRIPNDQKFGGFKFHIHAPGGIDAGKTFGTNLPHLDKGESEITFPGGIRTQNIAGAQPLNRDGTLGGFMPNPHFKPQAPNPLDLTPKPFQPPGPGAGGATGVPTHVTT
jgi:hypothetical protein